MANKGQLILFRGCHNAFVCHVVGNVMSLTARRAPVASSVVLMKYNAIVKFMSIICIRLSYVSVLMQLRPSSTN